MRLTDISIRSLPLPPKGQKTYWDETLSGFGCRVSQGGTRSFVLQFGADRQLITIGRYHPDILPLGKARTEAKRILAEAVLGKHRPHSITFEGAKAQFLDACTRKNKPRTVYDYTRLLGSYFNFGRKQLADISTADLAHKLDRVRSQSERRYSTVLIKILFRWAYRRGYLDTSPADRFQTPPQSRRDRTLSSQELAKALRLALAGTSSFHSIAALLMLTGQRRGEIAALKWDWVDEGKKLITLPAAITKNKCEHQFPVGKLTLTVLNRIQRFADNPYVFPAARDRYRDRPATTFNGWGKPKAEFDKALQIPPWTLHDLRRTLRTQWAQLGISREVAERYINHVSGVHSGVQAIYDRYSYIDEMRAAVNKWERYLSGLLSDSSGHK